MWIFTVAKGLRVVKGGMWVVLLLYTIGAIVILVADVANARVASRFSLSAGEEYNDNIFFRENKTHDFVTIITPSLHFFYQPQGRPETFFTADLIAPGEIYARNENLTNIGDRFTFRTTLRHLLTRQITITVTDCLGRIGRSRLSGINAARSGNFPTSGFGTGFSGGGGIGGRSSQSCGGFLGLEGLGRAQPGSALNTNEFIQNGETLGNQFRMALLYTYSPNLTFSGIYTWNRIEFLDAGGHEEAHTVDVGARYSLWRQHTLKARYLFTYLRTRDGEHETLHDFDVGDNFLSSRQINLTPTLAIVASTGLSMATRSNSRFRLVHRLEVSLIKLWRTAFFTVGVYRGLGTSFGVGGPAFTTTFNMRYVLQFSRRMAGFASAQYSLYDTQGSSDYETFQAVAGVQYWLSSWLSANLVYQFRRFDAENAERSELLRTADVTGGAIDGNSVVLSFAAYFDIWPNFGFGRGAALNSPLFAPSGALGLGGGGSGGSPSAPEPQAPAPAAPASP